MMQATLVDYQSDTVQEWDESKQDGSGPVKLEQIVGRASERLRLIFGYQSAALKCPILDSPAVKFAGNLTI